MALIRIFDDPEAARAELLERRHLATAPLPGPVRARIREVFGADLDAEGVAARVLDEVRRAGDAAVRRYTAAFDGWEEGDLRVPEAEIDAAVAALAPPAREALEFAAARIRAFHQRCLRNSWIHHEGGGALGQIIRPLERVGVYAPGGRAAYPSTVLMSVIPARVAGVREVVVATPADASGRPVLSVLAAARIAGADAVYRVGGAQAIAALAFGTPSIPRVDKIVGPGNVFVVAAKRLVYGVVGLDGLPGPTETVIIADDSAPPRHLALDLMAQAEHDPMAQAVLVVADRGLAQAVLAALEVEVARSPRAAILRESLGGRGAIVLVESIPAAVAFANAFAPEHLCLCVRDPWTYVGAVRHAGGLFVGELAVEAVGDYTAGPSHVMPTGGTARFASPLNVDDFVKITSVFAFGRSELAQLGPPAIALARVEGLEAHALAVEARLADG